MTAADHNMPSPIWPELMPPEEIARQQELEELRLNIKKATKHMKLLLTLAEDVTKEQLDLLDAEGKTFTDEADYLATCIRQWRGYAP